MEEKINDLEEIQAWIDQFDICPYCGWYLIDKRCVYGHLDIFYLKKAKASQIWNEEFDKEYYRRLGVCYECFCLLDENHSCPNGHI